MVVIAVLVDSETDPSRAMSRANQDAGTTYQSGGKALWNVFVVLRSILRSRRTSICSLRAASKVRITYRIPSTVVWRSNLTTTYLRETTEPDTSPSMSRPGGELRKDSCCATALAVVHERSCNDARAHHFPTEGNQATKLALKGKGTWACQQSGLAPRTKAGGGEHTSTTPTCSDSVSLILQVTPKGRGEDS